MSLGKFVLAGPKKDVYPIVFFGVTKIKRSKLAEACEIAVMKS